MTKSITSRPNKPRSGRVILRHCWAAASRLAERDPARANAIMTALSKLQRMRSMRPAR